MEKMRKKRSKLLAGMIVCCMAVCTALAVPAGTATVSASGTVTTEKSTTDKSKTDKSSSDKSASDKSASDKSTSDQSPEGSSVSGSSSFHTDESDKLAGAYEYQLENGTMKYWLDLGGDDLKLHSRECLCIPRYRDLQYGEKRRRP